MNSRGITKLEELLKYIKGPFFDHLIIKDEIVVNEPIIIPPGKEVEIVGGENGSILCDFWSQDTSNHSVFRVKSPYVVFNKLTIQGNINFKPLSARWEDDGLQSAIRFEGGGHGEVKLCQILGFNWGSVWQNNCQDLYVRHNTLIGAGSVYFNYGAWQQSIEDNKYHNLFFSNNYVRNVRHAIGSSGRPNNYYAIKNTLHTNKHSFDRHTWPTKGVGGHITHMINNTFLNDKTLAFSVEHPHEKGEIIFTHNKLNHSISRQVGECSFPDELPGNYMTRYVYEGESHPHLKIHNNEYV